jgi:hypothetical protein
MKIRELIELLQIYDQELEVRTLQSDFRTSDKISDARPGVYLSDIGETFPADDLGPEEKDEIRASGDKVISCVIIVPDP